MSEELLYTSAPRGLKAGARGFCTVEATAGMPPTTAQLLESLSGYRHLHAPSDPANPVVLRHVIAKVAGTPTHILSRIADAGLDYSGRSNKIAHHIALPPGGLNEAGPAWTQLQEGFHRQIWAGETRTIPAGPSLPAGNVLPAPCRTWASVTGDAGWAGVLAGAVAAGGLTPLPIVVRADQDLLQLLSEAIALLPPSLRWQATYTTFHTQLPPGTQCAWRFVLEGTKEAEETLKRRDLNQLDLRQPLGPPPQGPWIEAARSGERPAQPRTTKTTISPPSRADAAPLIEEPAELAFAGPGWEVNRPAPPPPPGRRVPYATRGDFAQSNRQSSKRSVGPVVVTLIALLATGVLGGLLVWTMDPLGRVATHTGRIIEESRSASDATSLADSVDDPSSNDGVEATGSPAETSNLTDSESAQNNTANSSADGESENFDTSKPRHTTTSTKTSGNQASLTQIEQPPEPTTFFAGKPLHVGEEPTDSMSSIAFKSASARIKNTTISFVVHADDAPKIRQDKIEGTIRIGQQDDISDPPPFMEAAVESENRMLRLTKLEGPRLRLASLAIRLDSGRGSTPEFLQFTAPQRLEPLIKVDQSSEYLGVADLEKLFGQSWQVRLDAYIDAEDLSIRLADGPTTEAGEHEFVFRKASERGNAVTKVEMTLRASDPITAQVKGSDAARRTWASVQKIHKQKIERSINALDNSNAKKTPDSLPLLSAKLELLSRDFDSLVDYVLKRRSNDDDREQLVSALAALDKDFGLGKRLPSIDSRDWQDWQEGSKCHKEITRKAQDLQGELDVVIKGVVLSDDSECDLVIATTRDIPEAPRDE